MEVRPKAREGMCSLKDHGVLKARIRFAVPFSGGLPFLRTLHHDPSVMDWVALHSMAHSFIELDKAVVHVISLISFL